MEERFRSGPENWGEGKAFKVQQKVGGGDKLQEWTGTWRGTIFRSGW